MDIWRIEHHQTKNGMWYSHDREFNPFIETLTEGISAELPMEYDPRYSKDNYEWFCGTQSKELLVQWFSLLDAKELAAAGFKVYEIKSSQYVIEEAQTLFTVEGIITKQEIELSEIWDYSSLD